MNINWSALGVVSAVSIVATLLFVALLSGGIRLVAAANVRAEAGGSPSSLRSSGYALLGLAGALVLYGIYLIVPVFH